MLGIGAGDFEGETPPSLPNDAETKVNKRPRLAGLLGTGRERKLALCNVWALSVVMWAGAYVTIGQETIDRMQNRFEMTVLGSAARFAAQMWKRRSFRCHDLTDVAALTSSRRYRERVNPHLEGFGKRGRKIDEHMWVTREDTNIWCSLFHDERNYTGASSSRA